MAKAPRVTKGSNMGPQRCPRCRSRWCSKGVSGWNNLGERSGDTALGGLPRARRVRFRYVGIIPCFLTSFCTICVSFKPSSLSWLFVGWLTAVFVLPDFRRTAAMFDPRRQVGFSHESWHHVSDYLLHSFDQSLLIQMYSLGKVLRK